MPQHTQTKTQTQTQTHTQRRARIFTRTHAHTHAHTPRRTLTERILHDELVLLPHDAERSPSALSGRDRVRLDPAAARELIEVVTRLHVAVHRSDDRRRHRHTRRRQAHRCQETGWRC